MIFPDTSSFKTVITFFFGWFTAYRHQEHLMKGLYESQPGCVKTDSCNLSDKIVLYATEYKPNLLSWFTYKSALFLSTHFCITKLSQLLPEIFRCFTKCIHPHTMCTTPLNCRMHMHLAVETYGGVVLYSSWLISSPSVQPDHYTSTSGTCSWGWW